MAMPNTLQELTEFHQFAAEQLVNGSSDLSLEELLDRWRASNPTEEELRESLASLKRGLEDIRAGRVRPAEEVLRELRAAQCVRRVTSKRSQRRYSQWYRRG